MIIHNNGVSNVDKNVSLASDAYSLIGLMEKDLAFLRVNVPLTGSRLRTVSYPQFIQDSKSQSYVVLPLPWVHKLECVIM